MEHAPISLSKASQIISISQGHNVPCLPRPVSHSNDIFISPIDISDNNMPNANSIMLLNFSRLGFKQEAKELADSLNGYLNIYKNFMISSVKSLDFFKETENGKNCNSEGCSI